MASQLLTFNPAFLRGRGGVVATGTEPVEVHSLNRLVLLASTPMEVLAVRWPGYDQDATTATSLGGVSITTDGEYLPASSVYGTAGQGLEFDISSFSLSDGWIRVPVEAGNYQTADYPVIVLSGATTDLFRLITTATNTLGTGVTKAQYWDGSAWQDIATLSTGLTTVGDSIVDIHWNIADSGGEITVYVNGVSEASYSGDTLRTADTTIDTVTLCSMYNDSARDANYGPLIVADADTRGLAWDRTSPNANGAHTEFTGGEPEVDDVILFTGHDTDSAVADADGERMSLAFSSVDGAYAGYSVAAVAIVFSGEAQADPGLYLKPLVRKSSADYNPTGSAQLNSTDGAQQFAAFTMLTDPSTGSAWADQAAVNACELGLEASSTA